MTRCLIVAFYNGKRTGNQELNYNNYLKIHNTLYDKVLNKIDKIYFVIGVDNLKHTRIEPSQTNKKIIFYYRNNKNLSFGSWVDVMNATNYDYYILCEDDYCFIKDNFDTILINEYNKYNTDYHVLWKNERGICTIGIISKNKSLVLKDYNKKKYKGGKGASMSSFLAYFKNISFSRNIIFPYYCFLANSIHLYMDGDNKVSINSKREPKKFLKLINEIEDNDKPDKRRPILCCYQYLEAYAKGTSCRQAFDLTQIKSRVPAKPGVTIT